MIDDIEAIELVRELKQIRDRRKKVRGKLIRFIRKNRQILKDNYTLQHKLGGGYMADYADINLIDFCTKIFIETILLDKSMKIMKGETINVQKSSDD